MSLYADYLKEKESKLVYETEKGFVVYEYRHDETQINVYISTIYVVPEFRKMNYAGQMADEVVKEAKSRGCRLLYGSVIPSAIDSTISVKVLLGYGMTLDSSTQDFILFRKEI